MSHVPAKAYFFEVKKVINQQWLKIQRLIEKRVYIHSGRYPVIINIIKYKWKMSWGGKRIRYSEYKDLKIGQKLGGKLNVGQKCGKICKNMQGQIGGGKREIISAKRGVSGLFVFTWRNPDEILPFFTNI